ncbi:ABC transporter substrate-binding protein [Mesorhizobium sp.]|uniref:ABC transporter substrate-binding protein n=1 Tax=Mesorhizobium sp. TaxID=1871066 RepID=UPI000FE3033C|nr:ABC transporter substrate-binding protein [Mesorhizobium sp.]RWA67757.1 MAG: branched-chain amino acid ABC transporter substrate-binding protein [Mesorhizobium sp.]RWB96999.1 MAG: branched-chain amino acid ABC transporter substrate-binding protein [Mesorhizobium sp.]RWG85269.1 MAG: branched-chain amino acid ABC transporter substrate-binding protein [Mesorhizobium sp.]RWG89054.1 MAG: branched-chain amino acid ABC transporter substrate-binding protein [Mesorhizobium sp.]RWK06883.1 MAG: branch
MTSAVPSTLAAFLCLLVLVANVSGAAAQEAAGKQPIATARPEKKIIEIKIGYLRAYAPQLTLSLLDQPPSDEGIAGAKVAIGDNNTTGTFLGQKFSLDITEVKPTSDAVQAFDDLIAKGDRYVVVDLSARQLLSIADIARDKGVLIFNIGATDDSLREEDCRINVFHIAPTRSMLADALAQYLMVKKWPNWVLLYGSHEQDHLYADALRRAAARFGAQIVAEKEFKDTGTARRTDTGATQIQQQISVFTQDLPEHDVVLVADESEVFGTYVPYRTWTPRPVAGTAGLVASSWHPASEQWGGIQMQSRFLRTTGRRMLSKDMSAWTAVRAVGEAATRTNGDDPKKISDYIRSDDFSVAAFKGQKLTFRKWNLQLRQPILLGDAKSVVSTSPQEGYLHQVSELDTLGVDQPETKCALR